MALSKWEQRFLGLAEHISSWSLDPSTKVGAVITDRYNRIVSLGFNGFPRGIEDTPERLNDRVLKNKFILHAERNAIIFAKQDLSKTTITTFPFQPCSACASMIIQAGIKKCVSPKIPDRLVERWGDDVELATQLFKEAKVRLILVET